MHHTLYTNCPACEDQRVVVVELVKPEKTVLVECDCGQFFAVHLRVAVRMETVCVPKSQWAATPKVLPFNEQEQKTA